MYKRWNKRATQSTSMPAAPGHDLTPGGSRGWHSKPTRSNTCCADATAQGTHCSNTCCADAKMLKGPTRQGIEIEMAGLRIVGECLRRCVVVDMVALDGWWVGGG